MPSKSKITKSKSFSFLPEIPKNKFRVFYMNAYEYLIGIFGSPGEVPAMRVLGRVLENSGRGLNFHNEFSDLTTHLFDPYVVRREPENFSVKGYITLTAVGDLLGPRQSKAKKYPREVVMIEVVIRADSEREGTKVFKVSMRVDVKFMTKDYLFFHGIYEKLRKKIDRALKDFAKKALAKEPSKSKKSKGPKKTKGQKKTKGKGQKKEGKAMREFRETLGPVTPYSGALHTPMT